MTYYAFKKPEDGSIHWADIIGRITVGLIVGIMVWVLEVLIGTGWGSSNVSYDDPENNPYFFPIEDLVSRDYLLLPIAFGLVVMVFPVLFAGMTEDHSCPI
jgi:hypothetical protein